MSDGTTIISAEEADKKWRVFEQSIGSIGFRIYKKSKNLWQEDYSGKKGRLGYVEIIKNIPDSRKADGKYFHITLKKYLPRIMRQGLVPRDAEKRGDKRGDRIYLSTNVSFDLMHSLFSYDNDISEEDCVILEIKLNESDNVTIYRDRLGDEHDFYTTDNIPPSAISVCWTYEIAQEDARNKYAEFIEGFSDVMQIENIKYNISYWGSPLIDLRITSPTTGNKYTFGGIEYLKYRHKWYFQTLKDESGNRYTIPHKYCDTHYANTGIQNPNNAKSKRTIGRNIARVLLKFLEKVEQSQMIKR